MPDASVAIIGGGISGLVCSIRLNQLGFKKVTVFDTGKNAPGGRCSSRKISIKGQLHTFDHSSQYFTVSDKKFATIVSFLHTEEAIKIWNGNIGKLKNGVFQGDTALTQAFIGVDGMQSISDCLASHCDVKRPVWVNDVAWEPANKKWRVDRHGYYDYLVIAHNGKCADKLMSNAGAPEVHNLLQVRFNDTWNPRDRRMHLCSLWVLMVAFETKLGLKFEGAHVQHSDISWVSNNTAKYGTATLSGIECWTIISTKSFGKAHKVPQENIPPGTEKMVIEKLLSAFQIVIGIKKALPNIVYKRVQLWGAAVPINTLDIGEDCIFDSNHKVGVCGDWLTSPCIQGASLSGLSLAEKIREHITGRGVVNTSMQDLFKGTSSNDIGCFPVNPSLVFNPKK